MSKYRSDQRIKINEASEYAQVVELVDTLDLGSSAGRCGGSSPLLGTICQTIRTNKVRKILFQNFFTTKPINFIICCYASFVNVVVNCNFFITYFDSMNQSLNYS